MFTNEELKTIHKSLDVDTFNYQIEYWTNKIFQANQHLRGED